MEAILLLAVCEAGYKSCSAQNPALPWRTGIREQPGSLLSQRVRWQSAHTTRHQLAPAPWLGALLLEPISTGFQPDPMEMDTPSSCMFSKIRVAWRQHAETAPHTPQLGSCIAEKCLTTIRGKRAMIRTP